MNKRLLVEGILVLAAFLLGFVPQYVKARQLQGQLDNARHELADTHLRDLSALAYVQAVQKNYGLAAETSGRFFTRVRQAANEAGNDTRKAALEGLMAPHDRVMEELAKADPGVVTDLGDLYLKTRRATGTDAAQQ